MTKQHLLRLFIALAAVILISGLVIQIYSPIVKANLANAPVAVPNSSQVGSITPATKCLECHHSEQLSRLEQLTTDPGPDLRPTWSPDGTRLAFYSGRGGSDDIWTIGVDGSAETRLTTDPGRDRRPTWSPDGTKIVFDSDRSGNHDIWIMNADGSDLRQLTDNPASEMFASFSPDGSQIIFYGYQNGHNNIWTMDISGDNLKSLTTNLADEKQNQCTFACHSPAFSPDGNTIAFHADADGARNVWLMDADGNNRRQLTKTSASGIINNYLPSWSPDGRIIFQAEKPVALTIRTDIRVIDPDGGNETVLFTEVAHGGPFIWSPDGTKVALHSQRGGAGNFDIFVASFGESEQDVEVSSAEVQAPPEAEVVTPAMEVSPSLGSPGIIAALAVALVLVVGGVIYGIRKFRRN